MSSSKGDVATIQYYDEYANDYEGSTAGLMLTEQWDAFTRHIKPQGKILDVGCGGGRDILHFQKLGFTVEAIEPTPGLARIARKKTNAKILEISVQDLTAEAEFDGIWACASLLHIPVSEAKEAIQKLSNATKVGGHIYISLKEGFGQVRKSDGRLFSSFTQPQVSSMIKDIGTLQIVKIWTTEDAAHRPDVRWLNFLLKK